MNYTRIKELDIAKGKIDFTNDNKEELNYQKWIEFVNIHSNYFIWAEDTKEGKYILSNISEIPLDFRERVISSYKKSRCFAEYDDKKDLYCVCVTFHEDIKKIGISFEKRVTLNDLKLYLDMANYLDAYLLYKGSVIIDSEYIDSLD